MSEDTPRDQPTELSSLQPGQKVGGRITKIELYGAFVDIGVEVEGFIHISNLHAGRVNRVEDVVDIGKNIEGWVTKVDPEKKRLELSLVRPVDLKWKDIKPGMELKGEVVRIEDYGAFIDVGAERPGLVHVSEMSTEYVPNPRTVVSAGDEVEVRVLDVNPKKKQMRLTMKPQVEEVAVEEEETLEELPTAMEVALREAMEGEEKPAGDEGKIQTHSKKTRRSEQEDLLSRTLSQRMKSHNTDN